VRVTGGGRAGLLTSHGVSETAARVYLALVDQPCLPAAALGTAAQVPRSHLYNVLQELQDLGLVEILLDESRRVYRARPFAEYLDRRAAALREQVELTERLAASAAAALAPPPLSAASDSEPGIRLLLGRRSVARQIDDMLATSTREIDILVSDNGWGRIARHLRRWREERSDADVVQVRLYLPPATAAYAQPDVDASRNVVLRRLALPNELLALVVDGRQGLFVSPIPDTPDERVGKDVALLMSDPAFVRSQLALVLGASTAQPARGAWEAEEREERAVLQEPDGAT